MSFEQLIPQNFVNHNSESDSLTQTIGRDYANTLPAERGHRHTNPRAHFLVAAKPIQSWLTTAVLAAATGLLVTPAGHATEQPARSHIGTAKTKTPDAHNSRQSGEPELKNAQTQAVAPQVASQVETSAAAKRTQLLAQAQTALAQSNKALEDLDAGNRAAAITDLEGATGKLELILAQDPRLALAPVGVSTVVHDLYASPDTAGKAVIHATELLDAGKVQQARALLQGLASEADIQVSNIPLATYPAAIKAIAPLIGAGKIDEAKAGLDAALNTLVVENYVLPLPPIRVKAILANAEKLAEKSERSDAENKQLHDQLEAARDEVKLGQVLGYGSKDIYQPLYGQIDKIESKVEGGKSGHGFFDSLKHLLDLDDF